MAHKQKPLPKSFPKDLVSIHPKRSAASFRLTEYGLCLLNLLAKDLGLNKTTCLEFAIRELGRHLRPTLAKVAKRQTS